MATLPLLLTKGHRLHLRARGMKFMGEKIGTTCKSCQGGESEEVKGSFKEVEDIEDLSANGHEFQKAQRFENWSGGTGGQEGMSRAILRAGAIGNDLGRQV